MGQNVIESYIELLELQFLLSISQMLLVGVVPRPMFSWRLRAPLAVGTAGQEWERSVHLINHSKEPPQLGYSGQWTHLCDGFCFLWILGDSLMVNGVA